MKKTSARASKPHRSRVDWSRARPNKFAKELADKRWWVTLDPDLVALLSGSGGLVARLLGFAERRRSSRERLVITIPMAQKEFMSIRPILDRIGAKYEYVPPHPNARLLNQAAAPRRRKAG